MNKHRLHEAVDSIDDELLNDVHEPVKVTSFSGARRLAAAAAAFVVLTAGVTLAARGGLFRNMHIIETAGPYVSSYFSALLGSNTQTHYQMSTVAPETTALPETTLPDTTVPEEELPAGETDDTEETEETTEAAAVTETVPETTTVGPVAEETETAPEETTQAETETAPGEETEDPPEIPETVPAEPVAEPTEETTAEPETQELPAPGDETQAEEPAPAEEETAAPEEPLPEAETEAPEDETEAPAEPAPEEETAQGFELAYFTPFETTELTVAVNGVVYRQIDAADIAVVGDQLSLSPETLGQFLGALTEVSQSGSGDYLGSGVHCADRALLGGEVYYPAAGDGFTIPGEIYVILGGRCGIFVIG